VAGKRYDEAVARLPHCGAGLLGLLGVACLLTASSAEANGRVPEAQYLLAGPGMASTTLVVRTTFGILVSDDSGKSFHYVCEDALGYGGAAFDPAIALDTSGRVIVGLYDGMSSIATDRCNFPLIPSFAGEFVTDLDQSPAGDVIVGVTATGWIDRKNYVWRSDDTGKTFKALGSGLLGIQFDTVELARSNLSRLYATGLQLVPRKVMAYRSDDGGATLKELAIPVTDPISAYVAAVDPNKPDTVYLRVLIDTPVDAGTKRSTVLIRSDDGGGSFVEVARTSGQMLGFALSDDGKTLWYGGPDPSDGLFRMTVGGTAEKIATTAVQCLRYHGGTLYVCGLEGSDGYALGKSTDLGKTIVPLLHLGDIGGPFTCPADSVETKICPAKWAAAKKLFTTSDAGVADAADAGDSTVGSDAGVDAAPFDATLVDTGIAPPPSGGVAQNVGCATGRTSHAGSFAWFLLALPITGWARRRRRSLSTR
jgi:hypothetical protein